MANADNNPLNSFKATTTGSNDVHIEPLPKLAELVKENGFADGLGMFDVKLEQWRQNLERTINERISGKQSADVQAGGA